MKKIVSYCEDSYLLHSLNKKKIQFHGDTVDI